MAETTATTTTADYRGSNMEVIADAHRKAHEADTQRRSAPMCSYCGMGQDAQLSRPTERVKLMMCGRCKSAQYCNARCQKKHWPTHKVLCKQISKERKAQKAAVRELKSSEIQQQINSLADDDNDDLSTQATKIIGILKETMVNDDEVAGMKAAVACANTLTENPPLLVECHNRGDTFYIVLRDLLERDLRAIQNPPTQAALIFPSYHMAMNLLQCFPGEYGYRPGQKKGAVAAYNEERCVAYFSTCWKEHLNLCVGLWHATRKGNSCMFVPCKDFWRQLTTCLVYEDVAHAIFTSKTSDGDALPFSNHQSPRLKPLLGMLNLRDMADDLEGLTNQVAALLVVHARNLNESAAALEKSVIRKMDSMAKMQWRRMSLVIAKEMVLRGRQLSSDEYRRIMMSIH